MGVNRPHWVMLQNPPKAHDRAMSDAVGTPTLDTPSPPDPEGGAAQPSEPPKGKHFKFPTAFTVLAGVLLLVWIASFFVPAGAYRTDDQTGGPVPGTYAELPACDDLPADTTKQCLDESLRSRFKQLWISIPNGLYGVERPDDGHIGPN